MAIADYLNKLVQLKNDLVTTLRNKGVEVSDDEKLNTLVPKVEEVETEQNVEWIDDISTCILEGYRDNTDDPFRFNSLHLMLKKIILPYGLTEIGSLAFEDCPRLKSIVIPDSVTTISYRAFKNCYNLENIYYTGTEEQWNAISKSGTGDESTGWNANMGSNVEGGTVIHYNYVPE
ncbi:MAG: leucine-rich repeat domain-containing protein [Oscillospiraceae bacterium]|nr:leucine-rich repeat domain-containing protein [Oscillospiraceae bacterium]